MFRRSRHDRTDELRALFLANREQVRSWLSGWECPEVEFPEFSETPTPIIVRPGGEREWLKHRAPFMDEYYWLLDGRPLARGIGGVDASWWFGPEHAFQLLEIQFRSTPDPPYLAEMLALAVDAASLKGWQDEDIRPLYAWLLYAWLLDGIDSRPLHEGVKGSKRTGFIRLDLLRLPRNRTEIVTRLRATLTDTALDGTPLNALGGTDPA